MVQQIPERDALDVRVCSLSFQRHETSFLVTQKRQRVTFDKNEMEDSTDRHPLPLVELQPFSKKVWRREKSLPDFYERNQQKEPPKPIPEEQTVEITASTTKLLKEIEDNRHQVESRPSTTVNAYSKTRCHPKAEFTYDSIKNQKTNELIPSFVTRLERSKTTFDSLQKDTIPVAKYSLQSAPTEAAELSPRFSTPAIKVNGGRINQRIFKRPLLYLNPLDSYRQSHSWNNSMIGGELTRQSSLLNKSFESRHSFPLTASRSHELVFAGTANYPLKPIRTEYASSQSPHKFNSKLGAARNSLDILSKWGAPTKLEKNLEKEYEMNLERFRRERLLIPNDLKTMPPQYAGVENNPTPGEIFLRQAREANRSKIKKMSTGQLHSSKGISNGMLLDDSNFGRMVPCQSSAGHATRMDEFINVLLHPIDVALVEESESHAHTETSINGDDVDNISQKRTSTNIRASLKDASNHDGNSHNFRQGVLDNVDGTDSKHPSRLGIHFGGHAEGRSLSAGSLRGAENMEFSYYSGTDRTDTGRVNTPNDQEDELVSPAALSKTNLEYLNNLRRTGGLPLNSAQFPEDSDQQSPGRIQEATDANKNDNNERSSILTTSSSGTENINLSQNQSPVKSRPVSFYKPSKSCLEEPNGSMPSANIGSIITVADIERVANMSKVSNDVKEATPVKTSDIKSDCKSETAQSITDKASNTDLINEESARVTVSCSETGDKGIDSTSITNSLSKSKHDQIHGSSPEQATSDLDRTPSELIPSFIVDEGLVDGSIADDSGTEATPRDPIINKHGGAHFASSGLANGGTMNNDPSKKVSNSMMPHGKNKLGPIPQGLDSSVSTEVTPGGECGRTSAHNDNGDSGVSTTFLTTENSRPEVLQGILF